MHACDRQVRRFHITHGYASFWFAGIDDYRMLNNPIESYRKTQRELRKEFEAFTRANCSACPTPCCVKPARLEPVDIRIAEMGGWRSKLPLSPDAEAPTGSEDLETPTPCEFLTDQGCSFPADLRPYGCAAFICKYMHAELNRATLNRIKRLIKQMDDQHREVLKRIKLEQKQTGPNG